MSANMPSMVPTNDEMEEVRRLGRDWYEREIRAHLDPAHLGEFVVINVDTGEFEVDADHFAASSRALARFNDGRRLFTVRVGRAAAYRLGLHVGARR